MNNLSDLQKIKRHTVTALMTDDILMGILVLKGGNALEIAYDITSRGSIDIDFSMERDFSEDEKRRILNRIEGLLKEEFHRIDLIVFDVKFSDRPQIINDAVKSFWGGYLLEFKVIDKEKYYFFEGNMESIRRNALPLHTDSSTKFTVDISKYEYVAQKRIKDIEGTVVYVYSPEMLALEKLRALCQQVPEYKEIVFSMTPKSRARDFYDIYNLVHNFNIDFGLEENIELCNNIFDAKKVPVGFIAKIEEQKEFHRNSWDSVIATVNNKELLMGFDFYFDYVISKFINLFKNL
jgi:predicted nucleotidyltransferase component of viral defense system